MLWKTPLCSRSVRRGSAALLLLVGCGGKPDLAALQDPAACAVCHPRHVEEWSGSMHAYASKDPLFREMNAKGQRETNGELGDFCVQCHAPLAVAMGLTTDGLNLDDLPQNLLGINCFFCHAVDTVDGTHNNPVLLAEDGVMRGGIADPQPNVFHASGYSPWLDRDTPQSSQMCGSCHDIITSAGAHIERTYAEWSESVYGRDDVAFQRLQCGNCHLEGTDGPVAERDGELYAERRRHAHDWPGVDLALVDFPGRERQRALVQSELDRVLNAQLCVTVDPVALDTRIVVDLENLAAGHSFPSGAVSDRRVWVEVVATRQGEEVFVSGRVQPGVALDDTPDATRWNIGDRHFDVTGELTHLFWEVETVESNLLPAPTAFEPTDPRWTDNHRIKTYLAEGAQPDRVSMAVYMRPFPLNVARELVSSEGLDPSIVDAIPTFRLASADLVWTDSLGRSCVR